jgi:hypothetical protein
MVQARQIIDATDQVLVLPSDPGIPGKQVLVLTSLGGKKVKKMLSTWSDRTSDHICTSDVP